MNNHKLVKKNIFYVFISLVLSLSIYLVANSVLSAPVNPPPTAIINTLNSTTTDAIAVRIVANPAQYSIDEWYAKQGFTGSPQKIKVDGYDAIRDNRTVYVAATNIKGNCVIPTHEFEDHLIVPSGGVVPWEFERMLPPPTSRLIPSSAFAFFSKLFHVNEAQALTLPLPSTPCSNNSECTGHRICSLSKLYFNIYIITYNQGAAAPTSDVFGKILSSWKFNNNLNDQLGTCSFPPKNCSVAKDCGATTDYDCTNSKCVSKRKCLGDSDCSANALCTSPKSQLLRDVKRLQSLNQINQSLKSYKNLHNKYPILAAGTFLPQAVVSTWPSWQNLFVPQLGTTSFVDPINKLGVCNTAANATTTMAGFDAVTCWNGSTKKYYNSSNSTNLELPADSYAMAYTTDINGSNYKLCVNMETNYSFMSGDNVTVNLAAANCHTTASAGYAGAANNPPVIVAMNLNGVSGQEFNGYIKAEDPDGNAMSFSILNDSSNWSTWNGGARPVLKPTNDPKQKKLYSSKAGAAGTYSVSVMITDSNGASVSTTTSIKISAGAPIITASDVDYDLSADPNSYLDYNLYFDDVNFDHLELTFNTSLVSAAKNWLKNIFSFVSPFFSVTSVLAAYTPPVACTHFDYTAWDTCDLHSVYLGTNSYPSQVYRQYRDVTNLVPAGCDPGDYTYYQSCTPAPACTSWATSAWSACSGGTQTRTVTAAPAGCSGTPTAAKPTETQSCTVTPPTCTACNYSSNWSTCVGGTQTKSLVSVTPVGCTGGCSNTQTLTQACTVTPPSCYNYTYTDWSACSSSGNRSRGVIAGIPAGCSGGAAPVTNQSCTPTCASFTYSDWSACSMSGQQTRTVTFATPFGCVGGDRETTQSCVPMTTIGTTGIGTEFDLGNGLHAKLYREADGRYRLNIYGTVDTDPSIAQDTNLNYKIKVFNSLGRNAERSFAIKLKANPPKLDFSCNKKTGIYENYSCQINNLNIKNRATTYTYSHTSATSSTEQVGLPAGFTGNSSTGLISGMPTNIGSYKFKIKAENEYGALTEKEYELVVESACGKTLVQYPGGPWDQRGEVKNQGGYYKTALIGGQCWLADNLNVSTASSYHQYEQHLNNFISAERPSWLDKFLTLLFKPLVVLAFDRDEARDRIIEIRNGIGIGLCYNNDNAYCEADGRLYKASEIMAGSGNESVRGICPEGYHIPSKTEYTELETTLGAGDANNSLKQNGDSGFEGFLAGKAGIPTGTTTITFSDRNNFGTFWSSTIQNVKNWYRRLSSSEPGAFSQDQGEDDDYYSLRCIQDKLCPATCASCDTTGNCCSATSWNPAPNTKCGNFIQTSNCGTTQMATGTIACVAPQTCGASNACTCVPNCTNRSCGSNGCGGTCGTCAAGTNCANIGGGGTSCMYIAIPGGTINQN